MDNNKKSPMTKPTHLEKVSDSCLAFRLDNQYISDNSYLFIAPHTDFCRACFNRRYLTQMMNEVKNIHLHSSVLSLALNLDKQYNNESWQAYSIADQKLHITFELITYQDCPVCSKPENHARTEVADLYKRLLRQESIPDIEALENQVFSFGFAHKNVTTQGTGLPNPEFDQLLGNHYEAKMGFRMTASDGRYAEDSAIGFDSNKDLAELKSLMEYLERYAFMLQICRFKTREYDDKIILSTLTLFRKQASQKERKHIRSNACWGIDLSTHEIHAIPLPFIFNYGQLQSIMPTSSGFGAHTDFKKSLCSSILELVERDAFVRFWHNPQRAFLIEPEKGLKSEIDSIISILTPVVNNETLVSHFFVIQSPTKLPVAMVTISTKDYSKPPSLCFGCGVGFSLDEAITGAIEELRQNSANLVKGVTVIDGFLTKQFTDTITSIPDRMNFYSTSTPREKLKFLDNDNYISDEVIDSIVKDAIPPNLDNLTSRFSKIKFDIYGIDCTPRCFSDKNVFVTKAFSPQLYPLQFGKEGLLNITTDPLSLHKELPHFFL